MFIGIAAPPQPPPVQPGVRPWGQRPAGVGREGEGSPFPWGWRGQPAGDSVREPGAGKGTVCCNPQKRGCRREE